MSTREAVIINTPADREKVVRWARGVSDGTIVEFRKSTRSHEQNAKMHAMLGEVSDQVVWYGQKLKVEDWKNMFTASLRKASVVPGIDPGTVVPLGIHTSTMTIDEMSNMIELIYAFGAENNVTFKEPKSENTNSDDTPSTASSSDNAGNTPVDEAGADDVPASDAPASTTSRDQTWLLNTARMLWGATKAGGDPEVFKNQRLASMDQFPKPDDCDKRISEKANSVSRHCREIIDGSLDPEDGLAVIAGIVGVDQDDILRQAGAA